MKLAVLIATSPIAYTNALQRLRVAQHHSRSFLQNKETETQKAGYCSGDGPCPEYKDDEEGCKESTFDCTWNEGSFLQKKQSQKGCHGAADRYCDSYDDEDDCHTGGCIWT
uniref:Uncharacterized protein n=1 Tax=Chromera velia CCMP2878 TaxID=1169474 RepID=A0A0G4GLX8_9ALVE|eukprot:Cvel_22480.t1-p1 / transcript=Cvel_22480.t1 / gene=Cvel_22480 / organism=Chromera_velia_CCMP2878 / gene_product=hypothetical protein / transcript_product=hypothetical protein / location=Cvel_scaffold2213:16875-19884(-) / protein_length=110 / sequence_SO=supercontig / SO=protein_coding / is_pseudo=false